MCPSDTTLAGGRPDPDKNTEKKLDDNPSKTEDVVQLSRHGYGLMKQGKLDDAMAIFAHIIEQEPHNHYALVGMGDCLRKQREYSKASEFYKDCLAVHPDNNYALFGLADCYRSMKLFKKAVEIWEEYLKLDSTNVTVLTRVADAYRKTKNIKRSTELYSMVLEIEPANDYALIGLGHLNYDFKRYEEALGYWLKMLKKNPQRPDIRVLTAIGNCYRKTKQFARGVPFFEQALQRESRNFYALYGLADCYRGQGMTRESMVYWERILKINPQNKVILTRMGDGYRKLGELDLAEEYYGQALEIEYDVYAVLGMALVAKERGELGSSLVSMEKLLDEEPELHRLYPEIIDSKAQLGDPRGARTVLAEFIKLSSVDQGVRTQVEEIKNLHRL